MDIMNINIKEILLNYYERNKISIMMDIIIIFILYFVLLGVYYIKSDNK